MHPCPTLTVLAAGQVAELPLSLSGSASVLGFTSLPRVFANASGRIEFIIFLIMDWLFASGCPPPRPLDDAVAFSYGQPVLCPTGTFAPLLVRTLRRTEGRPPCRPTHHFWPP